MLPCIKRERESHEKVEYVFDGIERVHVFAGRQSAGRRCHWRGGGGLPGKQVGAAGRARFPRWEEPRALAAECHGVKLFGVFGPRGVCQSASCSARFFRASVLPSHCFASFAIQGKLCGDGFGPWVVGRRFKRLLDDEPAGFIGRKSRLQKAPAAAIGGISISAFYRSIDKSASFSPVPQAAGPRFFGGDPAKILFFAAPLDK